MTTLKSSTFKPVIGKWNTMTVYYFAYSKSSKSSRFNSKYLHQSVKVEEAFYQYWLNEACLNVSQLSLNKSGSTGILILPC